MKVLVITYHSSSEAYSKEESREKLLAIREQLNPRGKLFVACILPSKKMEKLAEFWNKHDIEWISIKEGPQSSQKAFGLISFCRKNQVEVVHAWGFEAVSIAHSIKRRTKTPFVADQSKSYQHRDQVPMFSKKTIRGLKAAQVVIFSSLGDKKIWCEALGYDGKRFLVGSPSTTSQGTIVSSDGQKKIYGEIYGEKTILMPIRNHLILIYNSFGDPLYQNLMHQYILHLSQNHPEFEFDLITFEQDKYAIPKSELSSIQNKLRSDGIHWHPLSYHNGSFLILKKLYDFSVTFLKSLHIKIQKKPKIIIAFANTSAALAVLLSKFLHLPMMVYSYEPHSEFLADFGIWKRGSVRYKLLRRLEKMAAKQSKVIITGTKHMADALEGKVSGKIIVAPSAVDENVFRFSETSRDELRIRHGLIDATVLIYVGKFGGLYYDQEIIDFCAGWCSSNPFGHAVILTPNDKSALHQRFDVKIPGNYTLTEVHTPHEVAAWLSAADIGLSAIPPLPSQQYRSPVKVAEYLLCGLPYITCRGISEDDIWARQHGVGVVVDSLNQLTSSVINEEVLALLSQENLRNKCRQVGLEYRGIAKVHDAFEKALKQ